MFTPGRLFSCVAFVLASFGFRTYVECFGDYDATYASFGAVIVLLLWLWLAGLALSLAPRSMACARAVKRAGKQSELRAIVFIGRY
jgi:membrane protein